MLTIKIRTKEDKICTLEIKELIEVDGEPYSKEGVPILERMNRLELAVTEICDWIERKEASCSSAELTSKPMQPTTPSTTPSSTSTV